MDKITQAQRSANMSKIRSKGTKLEMFIRRELHHRHLRYRVNFRVVKGTPDLYFTKHRTAVFINGCFWHRHQNCSLATTPKTNVDFWMKKFSDNMHRDVQIYSELEASGIRVLVIWECTIRKMIKDPVYCNEMLDGIIQFIKCDDFDYLEI